MVVYPRWRGELNIGNGFAAAASGLSPLARGTPKSRIRLTPLDRFIPAGAGNTKRRLNVVQKSSVYPRWCGEHDWYGPWERVIGGLSPLARGTL